MNLRLLSPIEHLLAHYGLFEVSAKPGQGQVAELGASGNRYGTALVHRLEVLGVTELERRSDVIFNTWRRVLSRFTGTIHPDILRKVAEAGVRQLSTQRQEIESVVNAVDMRRVPRTPDFLEEAFSRCASRMRAELEVLSGSVEASTDETALLNDEKEAIVTQIGASYDNFMTEENVAQALQMKRVKAQLLLGELVRDGYLSTERVAVLGNCYQVTEKGTRYLIARGLV